MSLDMLATTASHWDFHHTRSDNVLTAAAVTAIRTSRLWSRYLRISDNIPEEFWHHIPQQSLGSHGTNQTVEKECRDIRQVFEERSLDVVVFWGTQSGRAELLARRFAKSLHDRYRLRTLAVDLDDCDHTHLSTLQKTQLCCFMLSTYGDGDPTDNTADLWSVLQKLQAGNVNLPNLNYMVFSLGNSNYRQFNRVAIHVDKVLQHCGATRCGPAGAGDDANGETETGFLSLNLQEQRVDYRPSYKVEQVSCVDHKQLHLGRSFLTTASNSNGSGTHRTQEARTPRPLAILDIHKLWEDDSRLCLHAELDLGEDRMVKYKTGDHLAIWPSNPDHEVDKLLTLFDLSERRHDPINITTSEGIGSNGNSDKRTKSSIPIPSPTTLDALFRYCIEISGPVSPDTVTELAQFVPNEAARAELLRLSSDSAVFRAEVLEKRLTLADVLVAAADTSSQQQQQHQHQQWKDMPLSFLLERCGPMRPRYYSITSSPMAQPCSVSIVAVVEKPPSPTPSPSLSTLPFDQSSKDIHKHTKPIIFKGCYGLATNYLHALEAHINGTTIPTIPHFTLPSSSSILQPNNLFARISPSTFKPPPKPSTPIIMIGAGTGVPPFRALVQERVRWRKQLSPAEKKKTIGRTLLYMGFRRPDLKFIYKREWAEARDPLGTEVFGVRTAFSRLVEQELGQGEEGEGEGVCSRSDKGGYR